MGQAGGINCLTPKNKKLVEDNIHAGESVDFCLVGSGGQALVALEHRLLILKSGFMAGATFGQRVSSFYYRDITGVEVNTGLLNGVIEVCTPSYEGTRQKDFWSMDKDRDPWKVSNCLPIVKPDLKMYQPYLERLRAKIADSKHAPVASQAPTDVGAELEKLAGLHARGVLTDDEFQQAKKKVLGL